MFQELRASLALVLFLTLLTGIAYPLAMTKTGQRLFPHQANGSLIEENGKIIGSKLIGQSFESEEYFHSRPPAAGAGYDATRSSGSNLAPTSKKLLNAVQNRVDAIRNSGDTRPIPVDLVTSSASGLDPDISVAAAKFQAPRIAQVRNILLPKIENLIDANITPRTFGILGENRVNVLQINRALDQMEPEPPPPEPPAP